jgi:DNA-binding transcriptional regulator YiaG
VEVQTNNAAIALRQKANLSQRQVAEAIQVEESTLKQWEEGSEVPRLEPWQTLKLTQLYQCTIEDLDRAFRTG